MLGSVAVCAVMRVDPAVVTAERGKATAATDGREHGAPYATAGRAAARRTA